MSYCPECGVQLEPGCVTCPLCSFDIRRIASHPTPHASKPVLRHAEEEGGLPSESSQEASHEHSGTGSAVVDPKVIRTRWMVGWEAFSVILLVVALAVGGINLLDVASLTWALYPVASILYLWLMTSSSLLIAIRPVPGVASLLVWTPAFLFVLDLVDGALTWALPVAVPIAIVVEIFSCAAILVAIRVKRKGLNILGYSIIAIACICMGIEATVDIQSGQGISLRWSAITAITLVPLAVLLLYLHLRIARNATLRRLLHF